MKRIAALIIFVTIIGSTIAYIPFNPLLDKDFQAVQAEKSGGSTYTIGWLDVPPDGKNVLKFDRVLVAQNTSTKEIVYVDMRVDTQSLTALPKGLFCWQSSVSTPLREQHSLLGPFVDPEKKVLLKRKPDDTETFYLKYSRSTAHVLTYGASTDGKNFGHDYQESPDTSEYPAETVKHIFDWDKRLTGDQIDRWGLFHAQIGVTEQYFREFFGSSRDGLYSKERVGVTMPTPAEAKKFLERRRTSLRSGQFNYWTQFRSSFTPYDTLQIITCGDLEERYKKHTPSPTGLGNGKLTLIDGYALYKDAGGSLDDIPLKNGKPDWTGLPYIQRLASNPAEIARQETDIRRLLVDSNYHDAVIQMASTRSTLEGDVQAPTAMLSDMLYRPVQGEEVALATILGSFARKYLMGSIDLFDTVPRMTQNPNDYKKVKVGWHPAIPVSSGYYKSAVDYYGNPIDSQTTQKEQDHIHFLKKQYIVNENRNPVNIFNSARTDPGRSQNVNLVVAAAHNMGRLKGPDVQQATHAKTILKADYLATLLLAALNNKQKVVLTLMGAGAFAGPYKDEILRWITDILADDTVIDIIARNGLEVTIINFLDLRLDRQKNDAAVIQFTKKIHDIEQKIVAKNKELQAQKSAPAAPAVPVVPKEESASGPVVEEDPARSVSNTDIITSLNTLKGSLNRLEGQIREMRSSRAPVGD